MSDRLSKADAVVLSVLVFSALVLGVKQLSVFDLGWHLAGGLWMLDSHRVPQTDPFGAQGNFWLCYSWFAEILVALLFKLHGFVALQVAQAGFIVFYVCLTFFFIRALNINESPPSYLSKSISDTLSVFVIIFFTAPIWYLRPQFFSLILLTILLWLAELNQLKLRYLIPLAILWVNIHVYWVLLPLVVLVYGCLGGSGVRLVEQQRKGLLYTFIVLMMGFVSPYGWRTFEGVWLYMVKHKDANAVIQEFSYMSPSLGLIFWFFLAVLVLVSLFSRVIARRDRAALCLFATFTVAAFMRIKFLPLFGIIAGIMLTKHVFPLLLENISTARERKEGIAPGWYRYSINIIAVLLVVGFVGICLQMFEIKSPLSRRSRALLRIGERISAEVGPDADRQIVLNHFNDGGWLALAFWLSKPDDIAESSLKTSIDGRTLVIGPKRIREFVSLVYLKRGWCEVVEKWDATLAVLPAQMPLARVLSKRIDKDDRIRGCIDEWEMNFKEGPYVVLSRITEQPLPVSTLESAPE